MQSEEVRLKRSISRCGKAFYVFDLDGNLLYERMNQKSFADEIGCIVQSVNDALNGRKNKVSVRRKILIFKEDFTEEKLQALIQRTNFKEFAVFDSDGGFIGIWNSRPECGKELGINHSAIGKCLKGTHKQSKGYRFYLLKEVPDALRKDMVDSGKNYTK